jgi:hypothetical protein
MGASRKKTPITHHHTSLASLQGGFLAERIHSRTGVGSPAGRVAPGSRHGGTVGARPTGEMVATHPAYHPPRTPTLPASTQLHRVERGTLPIILITVAVGNLMTRFTPHARLVANFATDITPTQPVPRPNDVPA